MLTTSLHQMHLDAGAKMVPFAGYEMPVNYPLGIKKNIFTLVIMLVFLMSHIWAKLNLQGVV